MIKLSWLLPALFPCLLAPLLSLESQKLADGKSPLNGKMDNGWSSPNNLTVKDIPELMDTQVHLLLLAVASCTDCTLLTLDKDGFMHLLKQRL